MVYYIERRAKEYGTKGARAWLRKDLRNRKLPRE